MLATHAISTSKTREIGLHKLESSVLGVYLSAENSEQRSELSDRITTSEERSVQISAQSDNRSKRYLSFNTH